MAKITQPQSERGVVVDEQGYFIAAWQWVVGQKPKLPKKSAAGTPHLILLTDQEALDPPSTSARWSFKEKSWELPTQRLWVVDAVGNLRGGGKTYWPERLPLLQPGFLYVDKEPPKSSARRPIYDPETEEWKFPRRVFVGDPVTGVCMDVINENPRADTENVRPPSGCERLGDDDDGHPVDAQSGEPVSIGCKMPVKKPAKNRKK